MSLINSAKSESYLRKWNFWLLSAGVVIYFFVNFQRSSIPGTIFNDLQSDFSATAAQVTNISAVFMYVYAVTQLLAGLAADKFGGARTIFWGGLFFCIGSLIFPVCSSLTWLLIGRVLVGLGAGTIYLAVVKEIDRIYPDKFTSVLGTIILLGYCGSIFGGLPLSAAVKVVHWRWAFATVALLTLLGFIAFALCLRRIDRQPIRREKLSLFPLFVVMKSRNTRILLVAGGVGYAVYYLMLAVLGKKLLEDFCNTPPVIAGGCLSMMVVVSGVMNCLVGVWSTKLGNLRKPFLIGLLATGVVAAVLGLIGLHLKAGTIFFAVILMLFSATAGFSAVTNSMMREFNPPQYTSSGASVLNFIAYLAVAVSGNLAGVLMDKFAFGKAVKTASGAIIYPASSYVAVMVMALLIALAALIAAFMLPETHGKNLYVEQKKLRQQKVNK